MRLPFLAIAVTLGTAALLSQPGDADAQILNRLKKAAQGAAEREASSQVDRMVRNTIRCLVDDPVCVEKARASGDDVVFVDDSGAIIVNDAGEPVTDQDEARTAAPPARPGEGAWANYDFVPGEEILFYDDYSRDQVGDFPRRLVLSEGSFEIVEWEGGRYLRAISNGIIAIPLPGGLPDRFTVESAVHLTHANSAVNLMPGRAFHGPARSYTGSAATVQAARAGVRAVSGGGPDVLTRLSGHPLREAVLPFRVMGDGEHMKVYLGDRRVANVPNAVFPRSDTLFLAVSWARESHPILIGAIRVAAGGRDLYHRLARDGRVTTQGILFATNSDRIRPESTPTLDEIGAMLHAHPELRIRIAGHTDSDGDPAYNQELSERRAASVRGFLIDSYGVEASRLESVGFGASQPVADNTTPQGKQQNRRVELVRLDG